MITRTEFNMLTNSVGCQNRNFELSEASLKINDTIFIEINFNLSHERFLLDFLERPFQNTDICAPEGLLSLCGEFPNMFIKDVINLAKKYINENGPDFITLKNYELKNDYSFNDYFEEKTGLHVFVEFS